MVTPVATGVGQDWGNVCFDLCHEGWVVLVKYEGRWNVRDVEPQPGVHDAEAGLGEEAMLLRLVAPEFP